MSEVLDDDRPISNVHPTEIGQQIADFILSNDGSDVHNHSRDVQLDQEQHSKEAQQTNVKAIIPQTQKDNLRT